MAGRIYQARERRAKQKDESVFARNPLRIRQSITNGLRAEVPITFIDTPFELIIEPAIPSEWSRTTLDCVRKCAPERGTRPEKRDVVVVRHCAIERDERRDGVGGRADAEVETLRTALTAEIVISGAHSR